MGQKASWSLSIFLSILVIGAPAAAQSSLVGNVVEDGLRKITFEVPAGRVKVFLPDDIQAGDTISGTVATEPNGKDEKKKGKNNGVLAGYVIDLGKGTKVKPDHPGFAWIPSGPVMPEPLNPAKKKSGTSLNGPIIPEPVNGRVISLLDAKGKLISQTIIPIIPGPHAQTVKPNLPINGPIIPEPVNGPSAPRYSIQPLGQTGRPFTISGNFDGSASNTQVTVGGSTAPVIAESPRTTVLMSPTNVIGATEVKINEGSTPTASGAFRNLKIDLTAPKTSLLKGESTELHVEVQGLQGITSPVPVQVVTTGSVNMQGGNTQTINIQPSQVGPTGAFTQAFGLTGTSAGAFNVVTSIPGPRP